MSTTRSKKELVRLTWLAELRRQGDRQYWAWDYIGNRGVCALQLLWEILGKPYGARPAPRQYAAIGARAGLSRQQTRLVVWLNDGAEGFRQHRFSEIADKIVAWFSPPVHLGEIDENDPDIRECLTPDAMAELMDQIEAEKNQELIAASTTKPSLDKAMEGWVVARRVLGRTVH